MLEVYERLGSHCQVQVDSIVVLNHSQRDRGRLLLTSDRGEEVRIFLDRGKPLLVGEILKSQCGRYIRVEGALEQVLLASCDDWHTFARACYHLGNRHTKMEVGKRWLRIEPDHVLEEMLLQLGMQVSYEQAVFIPETGAYSHGHSQH